MLRVLNLFFLVTVTLTLLACEDKQTTDTAPDSKAVTENTTAKPADSKTTSDSEFKTIEWTDLIPQDDLTALLQPPSYVMDVEEGSSDDQISNQVKSSIAAASDDRYQQALSSTNIIPDMDGKNIRIPGFIVPLEFSDERTTTQFFLVPFFGACIHVPPPPPNQIIFVDYPQGLKLTALYDPIWLSGTLKISLVENHVATSAYSLELKHHEAYTD